MFRSALYLERSSDDAYASKGSIQLHRDLHGLYQLQHSQTEPETEPEDTSVSRSGESKCSDTSVVVFDVLGVGQSAVGTRPFYDRLSVRMSDLGFSSRRVWRCTHAADVDETALDLEGEVGGVAVAQAARRAVYEYPEEVTAAGQWLLLRRESNEEPPRYLWRHVASGREALVLASPHPQPALRGVSKELVQYTRADGVALSGNLFLPKGYDAARDGPRPCLLWAYPREFKSAAAAGQLSASPHRFVRTSWSQPVTWAVKEWVVLGFAAPVVAEDGADGTPAEPNDTFVAQVRANAEAAVRLLLARGVGRPGGFAVGGHSYGAFMTAHLLAHTDLFSAGVARSGAYNRLLTPFGFQAEERSFWEASDTYLTLSPFRHAPAIAAGPGKLLLVHGEKDENAGTLPMQSERLFDALKGHGAVARLVMLPHEGHGYRARESILHVIHEQERWLDMHVLPAFEAAGEGGLAALPEGLCASLADVADGQSGAAAAAAGAGAGARADVDVVAGRPRVLIGVVVAGVMVLGLCRKLARL